MKFDEILLERANKKVALAPFVCWKVVFFWKVNSGKVFFDVW
jgi:hypothetical protein